MIRKLVAWECTSQESLVSSSSWEVHSQATLLLEIMKDPKSDTRPDNKMLDQILVNHGLKAKWDDFIEE